MTIRKSTGGEDSQYRLADEAEQVAGSALAFDLASEEGKSNLPTILTERRSFA
jgi:hypothetical protein